MSQVVPTVDGRLFGKLILDIAYGVTKYNSPLLHSYGHMPFFGLFLFGMNTNYEILRIYFFLVVNLQFHMLLSG